MILDDSLQAIFYTSKDYIDFLRRYAPLAHTLNYYEPQFIKQLSEYCRSEIAKLHPHNYDYIDKKHLYGLVYDTNLKSFSNLSSGTSGARFRYNIWQDTYYTIESNNHYKLVADEYYIKSPKVLFLHRDRIMTERSNDDLIEVYRTHNPIISHGFGREAEVHHYYATQLYISNYMEYYKRMIYYSIDNSIDIILASGGIIASIAYVAHILNISDKICKLLSNTNSAVDYSKLNFLKANGMIENWCDHMRCWDGGATFMTCQHGTKHLLDGLSWCYSIDGKLVSDDYFSVAYPFYKYWNGDFAEVSQDYELCKCGRYYRHFTFNKPRGRAIQYCDKAKLNSVSTSISGISRIETVGNVIRYFTTATVDSNTKSRLRQSLPDHIVLFETEKWTNELN